MNEQVTSRIRTISANFTRPADTSAYTAGDVVCNSTSVPVIMTFTGATKDKGGSAILMTATITSSANVATKLDCTLWLFDTTVVMDNDNAAFTPDDTEIKTAVLLIKFPVSAWKSGDATSGAGGNAICNAQALSLPINTIGGATSPDNSLYGVLVADAAYTPVSGEVFQVRLSFVD